MMQAFIITAHAPKMMAATLARRVLTILSRTRVRRQSCSDTLHGTSKPSSSSSFPFPHSSSFSLRTHACGELCRDHVGQAVTLWGWAGRPRIQPAHGLAFLPVHDVSGATQFVCDLSRWRHTLESFTGQERVVRVGGVVKPRPPEAVNPNQPTGEIEVEVTSLEVINEASHHPFATFGRSDTNISREHQLRERTHYLRLPHMQRNLRLRSEVGMTLRESLVHRHGFLEVETPTLFRGTPEGAQEFLVPTRTPGKFFSLAQSPQQFKQLLMVAGVDRYFQFARCYRDEDQRSDRQPEFTQIDLEMAFVDANCVMELTEELVHSTISSLCPQFSIPRFPFPRMEYRLAMERYGSDKPDTRYGLHLQNLGSVWSELLVDTGTGGREGDGGALNPHVFALRVPKWFEAMVELEERDRGRAREIRNQVNHVCVANSMAIIEEDAKQAESSVEELLSRHVQRARLSVFSNLSPSLAERFIARAKDCLGYQEGDLCVLATSDTRERNRMLTGLGNFRNLAADVLKLTNRIEVDSRQLEFLWVTNFPLFSVEPEGAEFRVLSTHHPFTAPAEEDRERVWGAGSVDEIAEVTAQHYDLVVNGVELGGGSIRLHDPQLQEHILTNILQVPTAPFTHLLKGLRSGCPPHGGIALGFDRLMAVLCEADSLRDVLAFPKSFNGRDILTGAPSEPSPRQLAQYHLRLHDDHSDTD